MRGRGSGKQFRLWAVSLALIIGLITPLATAMQTVDVSAAVSDDIKNESALCAMLSVGTAVSDKWKDDATLVRDLARRDAAASEYAAENGIPDVYNTSGSIGSLGASYPDLEWLSNALYQGDILCSDTFEGFVASYNNGADAAVIKAGLNIIDVTLTPVSDIHVVDKGGADNISSWNAVNGFASRFMLSPAKNGNTMDLEGKRPYRTRLFIVGIKSGALTKGSMYSLGKLLDYGRFLAIIGAAASDANYDSYLEYVDTYSDIVDPYDSDSDDDSDEDDRRRRDIRPQTLSSNRVIMLYLDGADLTKQAYRNLYAMLTESANGSIGRSNHIVIITGGSDEGWTLDGKDLGSYLYTRDGRSLAGMGATLGTKTQLWELRDGKLILIEDDFNYDKKNNHPGYMTDASNLEAFLKAGAKLYPNAGHYDLIMWDHGGGPEGGFGSDERRKDDSSMPLYDLTNAIKNSGISFDMIAFDACLMSSAEVAISLSDHANYLMLSEQTFPGRGLNTGYSTLITALIADHDIDTVSYYKKVVYDCIEAYADKDDATLAILDAKKVKAELTGAIEGFANALLDIVTSNNQAALDMLVRARKSYSYTEVNRGDAKTYDLIDLITFCMEIELYQNGKLAQLAPKLVSASKELSQAAKDSIISFDYSVYDMTSRKHSQGSNPSGISIYFPTFSKMRTPIGASEGETDQVLNLIDAYRTDDSLKKYGRALAAYAVWLKAGRLTGMKEAWTADDDSIIKDWIMDENGSYSVMVLAEAGGLTDKQLNAIIDEQVKDRIRKKDITVTDAGTDKKKITVTNVDPYLIDRVEVQVFTKDEKGKKISLGSNNMYAAIPRTGDRTASVTVDKFDNRWLAIDGNVVASYYDTIICEINGKYYRVGYIPVAYWKQERAGDKSDLLLEDAIDNKKVKVGVLEVRFEWDPSKGAYSADGEIVNFRELINNSIAESGWGILDKDVYELLAGFDEGYTSDDLRSIGVIQKTSQTLKTVSFREVASQDIGYNIVDVYENRYEINGENFPNDQRNMDGFHGDVTSDLKIPAASTKTADQTAIRNGHYDPHDTKSIDEPTVKTTEPEEAEPAEDIPAPEETAPEPSAEPAAGAPAPEEPAGTPAPEPAADVPTPEEPAGTPEPAADIPAPEEPPEEPVEAPAPEPAAEEPASEPAADEPAETEPSETAPRDAE